MGLRRKASNRVRWRAVVLMECVKYVRICADTSSVSDPHPSPRITRAILRFALLRITRRPLVGPPVPERDFDIASLPPPSTSSSPTLAPSSPSTSPPQTPDHLKNNHVPLQPHHLLVPPPPPATVISPVDEFLLPKALSTSSVKAPFALMKPLSTPRDWLVESLYILRPLIYGKTFNDGIQMDCAHHLRSYHVVSRQKHKQPTVGFDRAGNGCAKSSPKGIYFFVIGAIRVRSERQRDSVVFIPR